VGRLKLRQAISSHSDRDVKRVLYLNVDDVDYPRNKAIREFAERRGCRVVTVPRKDKRFFLLAWIGLVYRALKIRGRFDYVLLAEFSIQYAMSAKIVAFWFGCPLVLDAFVGLHESIVQDWKAVRPGSLKARTLKFFDNLALHLADFILIDTDLRRDALAAKTRRPVLTLPVGAPSWAQPCEPKEPVGRIRVLYYGNYIPLHGLSYVLGNLMETQSTDEFEYVFIGNGSLRPSMERLAADVGLGARIVFKDSVDTRTLASEIDSADIVLGVFGDSPKAASVLANKVWQGAACGKVVVTRKSSALRELGMLPPEQLRQVDIDEPRGLAKALDAIAEDMRSRVLHFEGSRHVLDEYVDERFEAAATSLGL
jgi:Glycosyl transferases group 1